MSQAFLDFAGLASALITRWPNPRGARGYIGYAVFLMFFAVIAGSHPFIVAIGFVKQSMRKAGYLARSSSRDNAPKLHRFLSTITPIPVVFMTLAAYSGGVFNSVLNLLIFYAQNSLGKLSRYGISCGIPLLAFPMLLMDYSVVFTKVIYTYWRFGLRKPISSLGRKSPLFTLLKFTHDKTYLRLFSLTSNNRFDQYDRSL